jgi:hypothetical protein
MQVDLSILFFIKRVKLDKSGKVPIYCRITVSGKRAELSINEKVESEKWNPAIQRVKGRSELVRVINEHIDVIESKIKSHFNKSIENDESVSAEILKDLLSGKRQRKYYLIKVFEENNKLVKLEEGGKYSKSTVRQYGTTLKRLKKFLKTSYNLSDIEQLKT